eukprot:TRINITY_DN31056_c0_g1_i1.p1 TRINITY_DN31056_c0_g1~~TRINITY_DN31056_c0_g1_i1.p1  ORF type:complete len:188 (-),score=44.76 TRINITY_DN31056_c0_g1_i1:379-942(-)
MMEGTFRFRVSGFGADIEEEDLRLYFQNYGNPISIDFLTMPGKRSGGVSTATILIQGWGAPSKQALFSDNHQLAGRTITVADDPARKVFVTGPKDLSSRVVYEYFKEFGEIEEIQAAARGFSFVRFAAQKGVDAVMKKGGHSIRSQPCTLRPAEPQPRRPAAAAPAPAAARVRSRSRSAPNVQKLLA